MTAPLITIKIFDKNGKKARMATSRKTRRIYSILKAEDLLNRMFYLQVHYPNGNKNEGDYLTKRELFLALKAFTEPEQSRRQYDT